MNQSTAELMKSVEETLAQLRAEERKAHEVRSEEWSLILGEITQIVLLASEGLKNIGPHISPEEIIGENPENYGLKNDKPYSPFQRSLGEYFNQITQHFFNDIAISLELSECIKKDSRWGKDSTPQKFLSIFTGSAIMDMYSLQLLNKYYGIPEQKLKGILYKQMVSKNKGFSSIQYSLVLHDYCAEKIMNILTYTGEGKGDKEHPVCPFHHSDKKSEFIDAMWEVSRSLIPQIQESYKNVQGSSNRFWSGNMSLPKEPPHS